MVSGDSRPIEKERQHEGHEQSEDCSAGGLATLAGSRRKFPWLGAKSAETRNSRVSWSVDRVLGLSAVLGSSKAHPPCAIRRNTRRLKPVSSLYAAWYCEPTWLVRTGGRRWWRVFLRPTGMKPIRIPYTARIPSKVLTSGLPTGDSVR